MQKILLIIQREYLSRVKKKSFVLMTLLVPVLFMGMIALVAYLTVKGNEMGDEKKVLVVDETNTFRNDLASKGNVIYSFSNDDYATEKEKFLGSENDYLLHISSGEIELLGEKKPGAFTIAAIENQLSDISSQRRLREAGIDTAMLAKAQTPVQVEAKVLTATGEKDAETYIAYAIGFLSAILIYMSLFIYGTQVMRGVIEEKTSRIIEVVISSVKPFQLMLGKIIGIGMVGLTQFVIWIVATSLLSGVVGGAMIGMQDPAAMQDMASNAAAVQAAQQQGGDMGDLMNSLSNIPVAYTLGCFLFYFLFGYLLYSSIFAAVGSAVDNETETQQFILPVTMPLIFTFILAMNFVINNPDSSLSVWLSMIPFTSPIAMMIRIPFGVPAWQLAASMLLMVGGFIFTTWISARIYRVGILMYGKKASYKELAKWFFYKE